MLNTKTKIALDFETTGLNPYDGDRPFIVGLEDEEGNVVLSEYKKDNWNLFEDIVQDDRVQKICHSAKFEIKMSKHLGLKPAGKFHDTMALAVLTNEYQPINLGDLSMKHFKDDTKDIVSKWLKENRSLQKTLHRALNYSDVPRPLLKKYLEGDLDKTLRLFWLFYPYICRNKKLLDLYNMETDLAYDIVNMEDTGILIDLVQCKKYILEYKEKQDELEKNIYTTLGSEINLASSKQLGCALRKIGINPGLTKKGNISTGYEELLPFKDKHPFINKFLQWKTMQKMVSTYLVPFTQISNERIIHPNFWQYGKDKAIRTGRFSATKPSLHTIPTRSKGGIENLDNIIASVKDVIVTRPGECFLFFDFKQIEMRIFAHYIQDAYLIKEIKSGQDVYRALACRIYGKSKMDMLLKTNPYEHDRLRDIAKQTALALIYGMGVGKFSDRLKMLKKKALEIKREFFLQIPSARPWILSVEKELHVNGFIEDIFGKHYHVPIEFGYKGVNAKCQGTAAIVMKKTIIKARELLQYGARPFATIHDELGLRLPVSSLDICAKEGKRIFEDYTTFSVPLTVDVEYCLDRWSNKQKYKFN